MFVRKIEHTISALNWQGAARFPSCTVRSALAAAQKCTPKALVLACFRVQTRSPAITITRAAKMTHSSHWIRTLRRRDSCAN